MYLKIEENLVLSVIQILLLIGGVERNPGPKCMAVAQSEEKNCDEGISHHQDTQEVQLLRNRVRELETQVLAVNVMRVTELAHQEHEFEQRLRQQRASGFWWRDVVRSCREVVPKDRLHLFLCLVLVAAAILILLRSGHKHHFHGKHTFWGRWH